MKSAGHIAHIAKLQKERDEADRAAGAAMRRIAVLEDSARKEAIWLSEAKHAEGYSDNTSFDEVWANVRAERDRLRALVAADPIKADTDRLDWLDAVNHRANARNGSRYGWKFEINFNRAALTDNNSPALSVRAAIDAARDKR
jgi:hypothetical protein